MVLVTGLAIVIALSRRETAAIVVTPLAPVAETPGGTGAATETETETETVTVTATETATEAVTETEAATETAIAIETETATATATEAVTEPAIVPARDGIETDSVAPDARPARPRARVTSRARETERTEARSVAPRRGTLRGLEQFERELGP